MRGSVKYRKAHERYFRALGRMQDAFNEITEAVQIHRTEDEVLSYVFSDHESSLAIGDIHPVYISLPSTLEEALAGCDRVNYKGIGCTDEGGAA
jgi:hypothetical protein